ncbi:hypothetical protein CFC21_098388 [Triticum aestivum]|uniref:Uncharacterized protein n=2 Tax=Triticum aestivum TaxID=4565 RepID=A0A3B6RL47_WHEAT|nr:hypothetical protein CFC21_098388 [Triticum aestivum]
MPTVKIVEFDSVAPPPEDLLLRLSALEAPWVVLPVIQRVFLFDDAGCQHPPFASLDRLPAVHRRRRNRLLASEGSGVRFIVAESDDADAGRLAGDADHDVDAFKAFVPKLKVDALPAEVLAVQVTRLKGGVAVGVVMHHAVVDGRSVWRFLQAWAAACRGDDAAAEAVVAGLTFDRAVIALPGGEEHTRSTLRKYAPNLPLEINLFPNAPINLPRRTFTVTAQQIHRLKQRVSGHTAPAQAGSTPAPSSFVAVVALAWVYVFFFIDCRGRRGIDPPVSQNYFGTCITGCLAKATARDLLAVDGFAAATAAVQREVRRAAEDPLALWDWMDLLSWMPMDRLVNISGSPRYPAYEVADFGWGAPSRTELITMNNCGQVVLVAAKGGGGSVQASVCMHPDHMGAFKSHFLNSLSG